MAHDVFISYSTRNKPIADAICAGLEAARLRCWIAPRDVLPGQNYGESIIHAIAACKVVVLVFSEATNVSQAVIREAERAMHHAKPIIPFRIEDTPMSPGLEFFLASCHWLDAIKPPLEEHIAHLARSVKGLMGEVDEGAAKTRSAPITPATTPKPGKDKAKWAVIGAGVAALAAAGGFFAWTGSKPGAIPPPAPAANGGHGIGAAPAFSPPPAVATPGLTLGVSVAGTESGVIADHFSGGARYRSVEAQGVLTIETTGAPLPGKVTVVRPDDEGNWVGLPSLDLDLKLLNGGGNTVFFQRILLEVASSRPESKPVWLVDGARLPGVLALRSLDDGDEAEEAAPRVRLGMAGPEDGMDFAALPETKPTKTAPRGVTEYALPREPRPGIEETLFGSVDGIPFELPLRAMPASRLARSRKDPEPLYKLALREKGEDYVVACALSQYIAAGEGDRFFLRLSSPVPARHRFTVILEYDDGSGGTRRLTGPVVEASLLPAR